MKSTKFAGIDEVGRGSLFGPVFAGAVILDKSTEQFLKMHGLKDSKRLSPKKRNFLSPLIQDNAMCWSIGESSSSEIDSFGIRQATEKAMIRAIDQLIFKPDILLIDGNLPLRLWTGEQKLFIKGEDIFPSIAAASVVAKVARDELITQLAKKYPFYDLEKNKGYGTKLHIKKLKELGPTELHRKTFITKIT